MTQARPQAQDFSIQARELVARRHSGQVGPRFDTALRPKCLADALALQDAVTTLWCDSHHDAVGGWKTGLPLPDQHTPSQNLILAPIFSSTIHRTSPVTVWTSPDPGTGLAVVRIEPELAFVLAEDLPARSRAYSSEEVLRAVGQVHMALELIHGRFSEPASCEFPEKLGDCLENQGMFIGPAVDKELACAASGLSLTLTEGEVTRTFEGRHPAGEPAAPLYWLAEFLRSRGRGLRAGQAIITGCYSSAVLEVGVDEPLVLSYTCADAQPLGHMLVQFIQRKKQGEPHD